MTWKKVILKKITICYLNHNVCAKYVRRKEDPEDVIDKEASEQQGGNF